MSEDWISMIIAEIAPKYAIRCVLLKSNSLDGIVRPEDTLEIYIVNGGLGYCGLAKFSGELMAVMNRRADFYHLGCETTRSEIDDFHATIAYEECHRTDDERSERM